MPLLPTSESGLVLNVFVGRKSHTFTGWNRNTITQIGLALSDHEAGDSGGPVSIDRFLAQVY